jgi:NADPH:quinone reductase-like Zn-dependent oxidoreductase
MDDRVELVAAASVCAGLSALICLMPMADMGLPQWVFLATAGSGVALSITGIGVLIVKLGEKRYD